MKSVLKKSAITALTVLIAQFSFSQQNFTLYNLRSAPQSSYLNPGLKQDHKLYINLPLGMQNFSVINTGFKLNDAIETRPQDDSLYINPAAVAGKLGKKNIIGFESYNELLGLGFRLGKNYFSFNVTNRTQAKITYTEDFYRLLTEGNGGSMLGQRVDMDGTAIDVLSYVEYGFGYNRQLTDKLTVGARMKFLSGVANVRTKKTALGVYTDPTTFDITVDGSAQVNTSNVSPYYKDSAADINIGNSFYNFANFGTALDFGATYDLTDKISLTASVLDFGFIRWKENVTNYKTNDFNFTFRGIDYDQQQFDSIQGVEKFLDSLDAAFNNEETKESYTTSLYTRIMLGGQYQLTEMFYVGALLSSEFNARRYSPALSLSGGVKLGRWLNAGLSYSMYGRSFGNVGLGVVLKGGPVQFFATTDNIFGLFNPLKAKYLQASAGLSIVLGKQKDKRD